MHPTSLTRRLLAFIMAAAICFSLVPWTVFAAETGTYAQVTAAEDFTSGQYVLVTDTGYAPGVLDGSWITAVQPTVTDGVVTDTAGAVWTLTVEGTSVKLTDANGVSIAPVGGNNNGIISGDYSWAWSFADGKFTFAGTGEDTVTLASNKSSDNKFRGYKNTTASGYPHTFTAYKLVQATSEPDPSEPVVTVSTIAEAKAMASGTENITVEGTVIRVDGRNVVVQDATGGINLYFNAAPSDIALGDVIRATGKRGAYNGLEQLTGAAEFEKTGTAELPLQEVTIADILADQETGALESTRVIIKGAVLGDIATSSNTALTQNDASINIYRIPTLEGIEAGDTVDVIAVVSDFKGYQLRVNAASDVTKAASTPAWNDVDAKYDVYELVTAPANGDTVVLYNPGNAKALSSEDSGYYKAGVDAAVVGEGYIASDSDTIAWTVSIDENGVYTFTQGDLKLGVELSGKYINLKTNAGEYGFLLEAFTEGGEVYRVRSEKVENSYGFAYLEWYASKNAFSAYATGDANETDFGFTFYKLVRQGVEEEEPEVPEEPEEPEETTGVTWTKTELSDITDTDTVAITMTKDGTTWVLPITAEGGNGQPLASYTGTIDGDTLTTDAAETYSWNILATEGGYHIKTGESYLYVTNANNGVRIGSTAAVWNVAEGFLSSPDSKGDTRYLGVYNSTDWRCYMNLNTIGGQTLEFWKLNAAQEEEPTGVADGTYVIWEATNGKAATALAQDKSYGYLKTVDVALNGDKLTGYGETEAFTITNQGDGTFTITDSYGRYLYMSGTYNSFNVSATLPESGHLWTAVVNEDGTVQIMNVEKAKYVSYDTSYGSYGVYAEPTDAQLDNLTLTVYEEPAKGIADGDYVIWVPGYNKALSSDKVSTYYNKGVDVTLAGEVLSGYGATEIWTVTNNDDGTITVSYGGQALAMADSFTSMTLGEKNAAWVLVEAGDGLYYVKNVAREAYMQWYAEKSYWSAYYSIAEGSEGKFALRFTPAERTTETDSTVVEDIAQWGGMPDPENTSFVYGDKYVSGDEKDTEDVFTAVVSGETVSPIAAGGYMGGTGLGSGTDDYLQFAVNAAGWGDMELSFRLRASNSGPGSFQLKYSVDGGATWQNFTTGSYAYAYTGYGSDGSSYPVTGEGAVTDGIAKTSYAPANYVSFVFDVPAGADNCENLLIRLVPGTEKAKGEGTISASGTVRIDTVVLSGSPVVADTITGYVTVTPDGTEDQPVGTELTMTSATENATIYYRVNGGEWLVYDENNKPALDTLPCNVEAYASAEGKADSVVLLYHYAAGTVETVKFTPNGGGIYIEGESSEITLSTATEGAVIYYATSADGVTFTEFAEYTAPILVEKGFEKLTIQAYATKDGYKESALVTRTFTERSSGTYQIYFGQLHSHTNISDGSGSVEEAFEHASNVSGLDFLAVTDHSNSFDGEGSGVLAEDGSEISSEWKQGHEMAEKYTDEDFVGIYGFEMTWSNGLGHINTFNTPGWQSRTQADYKTQSTALQNYYAALATWSDSISQFNHPGTTFGDFSDFAHYSEGTDALITLIEVGNGEGAIGSSGYFPSYEYYTRALDKGWHVAPTNNQDNHKGLWGDANTGRSVVLADSLTVEGIYDALRNYRVYATEDNDLEIYYTLNGYIMGSMLELTDEETVTISVNISDATDAAIGKVEVIVNGGLTAASDTLDASSGTVTLTVPADYNYYYIRITQPDGDIAVTAPVWVGTVEAVGISSLEAESPLTIAGEEQTFTAELYNNERSELVVESLVYTNKATGEVLYTDTAITSVPKESTAVSSFGYTFASDGVYTITATLTGTLNGVPKTYTKDLEVTVMPQNVTSRIIVDGTHYNDYVTGYYAGNVNNMTAIAAAQGIQVHVETEAITPELLEGCSLLIISGPAGYTGEHNGTSFTLSPFEDEFIATVADYVQGGGSVVVCGLADYRDKYASDVQYHKAAQLNKLLAAIGSTMSVNDDEAYDEVNFSNQNYRLYPESFNMESPWCAGIVTGENGQVYSQYSGCTVDPGQGTWLVKGFDTTYSIDSDNDGLGGVGKGEAVFLAVEETGFGGSVFVAGGVFLSDFEVAAELDNIWDLPYANRTIYENIIGVTRAQPEVTPIADVRASAETELGRIFVIEGYVTAGTDNDYTTFFDAIYVQDETGGITVFPYSEDGLEKGTKVRITGYTDAYQGDIEIQIMSLEVLEEAKNVITPEQVSNAVAMNYAENGGQLLQVQGEVVEVLLTSDGKGVAQFVVKDENGDLAKVFIDGYILSGTTGENTLAEIVQVGNTVSAVGLLYMHPEGDSTESVAVLRVRNCDEVVLISQKPAEPETDKTELEKAIDKAEKLDEEDYTKKSWAAMEAALKVAKSVYADENATQEEIDAATDALNAAIKALVPTTGKNPETGDSTMIGLCLTTMTLSLLAAVLLLWNRKRFTL